MSNVVTVSELNEQVKSLMEATFTHIMVEGEIGRVTYHASGHVYFNIKDQNSSLKCVMFRSNAARLKFRLEQGQHIIISGSLGVYKPRGEYQLYAVNIEPYGAGALAVAYEQLKAKLKAAGYFEDKKPIPKHISHIAIVTSKSGAAIADMFKVIDKRWPLLKVTLIDTLVQGENSAAQIARHIAYADTLGADVIVAGRGGGSIEDLWGFNEEAVAEAIHRAKTPVVSAVGHEVDTLISDFVADLRAPTPSAAMEMILPDKNEVLFGIDELMTRYKRAMEHKLSQMQTQCESLRGEFERYFPARKLQLQLEQITSLRQTFGRNIRYKLQTQQSRLDELRERYRLADPSTKVPAHSAFIVKGEKKSSLAQIKEGETFRLEDATTAIEAKALKKVKLS